MSEDSENKSNLSIDNLAEGLRLAREMRGKSIKESSQLLGLPSSKLRNYEKGKYVPSLPELESLSYFYNIPLGAILNPELLDQYVNDPDSEQLQSLIKIRTQFIATNLQISREKSGKSAKQISKETSISTSKLRKYENGESYIPLDDLGKIAESLDIDIEELLDNQSPIGLWQKSQKQMQSFSQLPEEIQSFALSKDNQPFISFTKKVKAIGIENLEKLADVIQKIISASDGF
jgi:transcriptional regulator with XRE-family HTH domain